MYGRLNPYGVVGRKAVSVAGFEYSGDLRKSGIVWDKAITDKFITAPKKLLTGTRMELLERCENRNRHYSLSA